MKKTSKVLEGVPSFVKEHLRLKDDEDVLWSLEDEGGEPFCKAFRGHPNVMPTVETPNVGSLETNGL